LPAHLSAAPADAGQLQLVISLDAGAPERAATLARRLEERKRPHLASMILADLGGALAFAHDQAALQCILRLPASQLP
jgi:hypothetical protein